MIRAKLETRHFTFEAYGEDGAQAMEAMRIGWLVHKDQTGATADWPEFEPDVELQEMDKGVMYRDGEPVRLKKTHFKASEFLAMEFSRTLWQWLTTTEMRKAIEGNRRETSPNVCHTHDHCDANMAMLEAFEKLFGHCQIDDSDPEQQERDCALWNRAWDMAKFHEFYGNREDAA